MNPRKWKQTGSKGFFAFLDDVKPRIPSDKGGYQIYEVPSERIRQEIETALDGDFSTLVWCWPRRHGKTVVAALIVVWRFLSRKTEAIGIVANSERQTIDTAFRLVRTILEQTPYTRALIASGAITIKNEIIEYGELGNRIQGYPNAPAALHGKKLTVAQVSELHAARTDQTYQTLASATIDSEDGLVMVDSIVGMRSSPLYVLYRLWETGDDPTIHFSHIEYRDLEDATENGPAWIRPERLRSRSKQMLRPLFEQQHLNKWGTGTGVLFSPETIELCKSEYPLEVDAIVGGRACAVGGGLDRSFAWSDHGDQTVLTCVLKSTAGEDDQPHFYVLESKRELIPTEFFIKRTVDGFVRDHGMTNITIEQYQSQDIAHWCTEKGLNSELVHATDRQQVPAFQVLANAASEGRLHIHPKFERLLDEMATMEIRLHATGTSQGTIPKFQHATGCHDDHVYSLAWAIYSLREFELNPYEISGIHCHARGAIAPLCVLNGGELIPACHQECASFSKIQELYSAYRAKNLERYGTIETFITEKMVNIGSHSFIR